MLDPYKVEFCELFYILHQTYFHPGYLPIAKLIASKALKDVL